MRNKIGDKIEVVIDNNLFICEIVEIKDLVKVRRVEEVECDSELHCYVTIYSLLCQ